MQKTIIGVLVILVVVLLGAIVFVNHRGVSVPGIRSGELPQNMMQNSGAPSGSMENMPCHKMGNGEWMGRCEFDEQGNIKS